jgi:hypothetical protein
MAVPVYRHRIQVTDTAHYGRSRGCLSIADALTSWPSRLGPLQKEVEFAPFHVPRRRQHDFPQGSICLL